MSGTVWGGVVATGLRGSVVLTIGDAVEVYAVFDPVLQRYRAESDAYHSTSELWDDGILDPLETREGPLFFQRLRPRPA